MVVSYRFVIIHSDGSGMGPDREGEGVVDVAGLGEGLEIGLAPGVVVLDDDEGDAVGVRDALRNGVGV